MAKILLARSARGELVRKVQLAQGETFVLSSWGLDESLAD